MSGRAIVIGATGYVASYVIPELVAAEFRVTALSHRPERARVLLAEHPAVTVAAADELARAAPAADVVVNCAVPSGVDPAGLHGASRAIVDTVAGLAARSGAKRVVHLSSMAVFGYGLTEPIAPAEVRWRPDDWYVETKIASERRLLRAARGAAWMPVVIRLGNVVGPGSSTWTAQLAQRMIEGRAVGVRGADGWSNATYAGNTAAYVRAVASAGDGEVRAVGAFHHLAELSGHRWSEILAPMSEAIGLPALAAGPQDGGGASARHRLAMALMSAGISRWGGYARAALGHPAVARGLGGLVELVRSEVPTVAGAPRDDLVLLDILSAQRRFENHVLPGWEPPAGLADVSAATVEWLVRAGFAGAR